MRSNYYLPEAIVQNFELDVKDDRILKTKIEYIWDFIEDKWCIIPSYQFLVNKEKKNTEWL